MFKRFMDWVLGPYEWPHVLVPFRKVDDEHGIGVQTIAGWFQVPVQLIADAGFMVGYRRWPSMDEAMLMDMQHVLDSYPIDELITTFFGEGAKCSNH